MINDQLSTAMGWTLLHSLWEGAAIAVLSAAIMALLRQHSSNLRYLILCFAMLLVLASAVATFTLIRHSSDNSETIILSPEWQNELQSLPTLTNPQLPRMKATSHQSLWSIVAILDRDMPVIVLIWLLGIVVVSLRQIGGWSWLLWQINSESQSIGSLESRFQAITCRLRIARPIRFIATSVVSVPATVGWLRPLVLIPVSALAGLTPSDLEAFVAHELAHIHRHDYLINGLQIAVESLFFYHPAVWWLSNQIRNERENCCDDIAAHVAGGSRTYATILLTLDEARSPNTRYALGLKNGSMKSRILRLIRPPQPLRPRERGSALASIFAMLMLLGVTAHLFGSAVKPSGHLLSANEPLNRAIYRILGTSPNGPEFLSPLQNVVRESDAGDIREEDLLALATNITSGSDPDALSRAIFDKITAEDIFSYQRDPSWTLGSYHTRFAIVDALWREGQRATSATETRYLTRAAVLLSAQDSDAYGVTGLYLLINYPGFRDKAGLSVTEMSELKQLVDDHLSATRLVIHERSRLVELRAHGAKGFTQEDAQTVVTTIRRMEALSGRSPDLEWQVAHSLAEIWPVAKNSSVVQELQHELATSQDDHLALWSRQAIELPQNQPAAGMRTLSGDAAQDFLNSLRPAH